jgi:hypothetical protein
MTAAELLLALADEETLELARRMVGRQQLALLLATKAIAGEEDATLDASAVAQILGVHKRHAYRRIQTATRQMKKRVTFESQNNHKPFAGESQNATTKGTPKKRV